MSYPVAIVHACQRHGRGGSPTAVLDEIELTDAERRAIPATVGTSHAVFIAHGKNTSGRPDVSLRFFTSAGELPACGHGTVAALAVLADGAPEYQALLHAGGRSFPGRATARESGYHATFDPGPVELSEPSAADAESILAALGIDRPNATERCRIASVGRPRILVRADNRRALAELSPAMTHLRDACDRTGLLGCYVYCGPSAGGHVAARMFAPSIGVPEDIANANSSACMAAHFADHGHTAIEVDMGDSLGEPATILARTRREPDGLRVEVGGTAAISRTVRLG